MSASCRDDVAGTWMTSCRRPLLGFVLPYVNGAAASAALAATSRGTSIRLRIRGVPENVRSRTLVTIRADRGLTRSGTGSATPRRAP